MSSCEFIGECPFGKTCSNPKLAEFGKYDSEILIVKSVPGKESDESNNLFGESSDLITLKKQLVESGIVSKDTKVAFSSLIRCGVDKKNKEIFSSKNLREAIKLCSQNMEQTLARLPKIRIIVPMGLEARNYFCQDKLSLTKSLGRKYEKDFGFGTVYVMPNLSPSAVHYNPDIHLTKSFETFSRISRVLKGNMNKSNYKTKFLTFLEFKDYANRLLGYYKEGRIKDMAYDIETSTHYRNSKDSTTVDIQNPDEYITGFSLADEVEDTGYYINLYHPQVASKHGETHSRWEEEQTKKIISNLLETIPMYAHNSKYDLSWSMSRLGIDLDKVTLIDDTLTLAYLLLGVKRDTGIGLGLKNLAKLFFQIDDDWDEQIEIELAKFNRVIDRRLTNIDFKVLSRYGAMDSIVMLHLRKYLRNILHQPQNMGMMWSYQLLLRATKAFTEIESKPVKVNEKMLLFLEDNYKKRVVQLHDEFNNLPETQQFYLSKLQEKHPGKDKEELLEKLPEQDMTVKGNLVKEFIFKYLKSPVKFTTDKGEPSLNKEAKEYLRKNAPLPVQRKVASLISEEIEVSNQLSKFLNSIKQQHMKYGGYFPTYNLTSVATGRLASDFHLLPSFGDIKYNFVSEWIAQGGVVMAPDYSQVEVRVFASLSGDPDLRQAYIDGLDIHKFVASRSFVVDYDQVTKQQRSNAKGVIFGMLYGQSVYTLSEDLGITVEEAQAIQDSIFLKFPKIKQWVDRTIADGEKNGYVDSALGRRRQLAALKNFKYSKDKRERIMYYTAVRAAMNHPVQSTASDVTLSSIVHVHESLKEEDMFSHFIGTVHDSLEFDVHPAEIVDMILLIKKICEEDLDTRFDWLNGVPYRMDLEIGMEWGSCVDLELEDHDESTGVTIVKLKGRDLGIDRLKSLFDINEYFDVEVLEEERTEEPPELDDSRVFNGIIHFSSKFKVTQKLKLTRTNKLKETA